MYCPAHFEETHPDLLFDLIARHPLATVVRQSDDGLVADHVPLLADPARGMLLGHVARANPLWRTPADHALLLVFQGPAAYVSPNWYPSKARDGRVVPTWNYAVVHVRATLRSFDDPARLRALLQRLTDTHEAGQAAPWRIADAPDDYMARMLDHVVGLELSILHMQGKWKMSQNQPADNRRGVAEGLDALHDAQARAVAAAVRGD
ncbi:FMN-binding negative transcriptional regulator [Methyloversatilis thermotolerans]|uniref:FMN-binding negative transcriptional regulator n=1 Tax=Methyloversatilis thermotolerans TaxID=1346290 RepID=UPI00036BC392|nr:FMN-binding negative transcriptional regulator [Methyloversatilis thermotolerans]